MRSNPSLGTLLPSPPDEPAFLVDRSLGRHLVPQRVTSCGCRCLTLAEFYGDERAVQAAPDTAWLKAASTHGPTPSRNITQRSLATRARPDPTSSRCSGTASTGYGRESGTSASFVGQRRHPGHSNASQTSGRARSCDRSSSSSPIPRTPPARVRGRSRWSDGVPEAEGGGFEPPRVLPLNTDSSRAP